MTLYRTRTKTVTKRTAPDSEYSAIITVKLRYDDDCGNGHNTFAITGQTYDSFGCIHDEIARYCPELAHLIKWHLVSDDVPMHYVANTLHHLGYSSGPDVFWYDEKRDRYPSLEHARSTALWPDMPESFICCPDVRMLKSTRDAAAKPIREALEARLPEVMKQFHEAMAAIEWDTTVPF